jgi:hypothetical protein
MPLRPMPPAGVENRNPSCSTLFELRLADSPDKLRFSLPSPFKKCFDQE